MDLFGRKILYTDIDEITAANVVDVLNSVLPDFELNQTEINYLFDYYKGKQEILQREKKVRPEINNKIVVNRANEIVSFKVGYQVGEPIQYIGQGEKEGVSEQIARLNGYMRVESKAAVDKELVENMMICGSGYRMVLAKEGKVDEDMAEFNIYNLNPASTFVVYHTGLGNEPVMCGKVVWFKEPEEKTIYSVYTKTEYFEIQDKEKIVKSGINELGQLPIIEYPANKSRLGAFEIVIPMLDAINLVESDRANGIEQFIQAILVFKNTDMSEEEFEKMKSNVAIQVVSAGTHAADVAYLVAQLDQTQTQVLVDNFYDAVLTICGMPNRNGGLSTSDTGTAVIMRDGWSAAEARAKDIESVFKKSENRFLKAVLKILRDTVGTSLTLYDIDIQFTRRNYDNIQSKAQVLLQLLSSPLISPELAFDHCGLFADSASAYQQSKEWFDSLPPDLMNFLYVRTGGQRSAAAVGTGVVAGNQANNKAE